MDVDLSAMRSIRVMENSKLLIFTSRVDGYDGDDFAAISAAIRKKLDKAGFEDLPFIILNDIDILNHLDVAVV